MQSPSKQTFLIYGFGDGLGNGLKHLFKQLFKRTAEINRAGRISITPRQIYIIPTRFGLVFTVMLIAMLICSNNYSINLGFMLTFILTGIGFATMLQTWRNLVRLEIQPGTVAPVYCGETAKFPIHIHNNISNPRPGIQVRIGTAATVVDIPGDSGASIDVPIPTINRGYLTPERWTIFSYFPLGIFYAWAYFKTPQKCLVFPAPANTDFTLDRLVNPNDRTGMENDESLDFHGHRKYQTGDNLKQMDWKALARGRGKLIKNFKSELDDETWLKWSEIQEDDVEFKLSILCRGVLELSRFNTPFGLSIPGSTINPGFGNRHKLDCLTALALF